ncbi:hypothetical protein L211DRAFT_842463 [Terfezia boudieri ATCC MYA-4762]|uniref:HTH APSES-type domain-containing protein n=1 Tax=Terfezia boudieri ATCC MYA-4762 TaxID=1051890 RepID=A0A3N4LCX5_9PEZI|nr:hypothetical protein L211DRAFT_842463 [Terfezia boudieri ATCC MYA-4762]
MTRKLPTRVNSKLREEIPPYQELVDLRRLGQTNLGSGKSNTGNELGLFSYVHLRAPLPPITHSEIFGAATPESYFLMRRSYDGFVSSTGMFKASFPWASKKDEEDERRYVKATFPRTSTDETAGNLWVHPADALILAEEYGMTIWIEALLDNQPVSPSDRKRNIQAPPPFYKDGVVPPPVTTSDLAPPPLLATANTSARRRSTRSASPAKRIQSPRKVRLSKASAIAKEHPLKSEPLVLNGLRSNSVEEEEGAVAATATVTTTEETVATTETTFQEIAAKKEPIVKVEIDNVHQTNGDVDVEKTRVKVEYPHDDAMFHPIPENTEDMMAKAKAMVEESRRLDGDLPTKKRKAEEDESTEDDLIAAPQVKRSRVLEEQLKQEKLKTKALIGLSIGLTLTALIPHFL